MRCSVCDVELSNYELTLKYPEDHPKKDDFLDMCVECIRIVNESAAVCFDLL